MEDQGAEEKEEKIPQARLSSFQLQRHPGWAHSPGGTATSNVQSSPPQIKPTGEGPRAWLRKRATLGRNGGQGAQRLRKKERGLPPKKPHLHDPHRPTVLQTKRHIPLSLRASSGLFPPPGTPFLQRPECSLPSLMQAFAQMPPSGGDPPCPPFETASHSPPTPLSYPMSLVLHPTAAHQRTPWASDMLAICLAREARTCVHVSSGSVSSTQNRAEGTHQVL